MMHAYGMTSNKLLEGSGEGLEGACGQLGCRGTAPILSVVPELPEIVLLFCGNTVRLLC